ncbi:MFS transporter [Enterococcus faecium]|nr:MFS transporter [Enterococcus faecium]MDQ8596346.1 MFS transporter [Enterococcus faecium]MDV4746740.1 MFS transporter [Enterococcus faecium]
MVSEKKQSIMTKLAVLSISLILMSGPAINGSLPLMKESLGISQSQVELLSTIPNFAVIIFITLSSFIANRIGLKRTVTIGLLIAGIGGAMPLLFPTYQVIFLSRFLLGAGYGLFNSLAVSVISTLFSGDTRATLLGIRNSTESIGQAIFTALAGLLLILGWRYSFAIYLIAFPILLFFIIFVPDVKDEKVVSEEKQVKEKLPASVYFFVLFAIVLVMNSYAITVRFPSLAAEINGMNYNASGYLALMPIMGIVTGFIFGAVNKVLKKNTVILGLLLNIIVNLLIGFASGNYAILLIGLFLSGVPNAFCFPYIYNSLGTITNSKKSLNLSTSLVLIGCNIGGFISPVAMEVIQKVTGSNDLAAPFPIFIGLILLILLGVLYLNYAPKKNPISKLSK